MEYVYILLELEQKVNDPAFAAREEEIWARMVSLRERARWLEEEGKRVAQRAAGGQGGGQSGAAGMFGGAAAPAIPSHVLQKTSKILRDYEAQLLHLAKELQDVGKEFAEYEAGQQARGTRR